MKKKEGNDHYKNRNVSGAVKCYGKALRLVEMSDLKDSEEEALQSEICKRIFLNVSLCCIHLKKYDYTIKLCMKVLKYNILIKHYLGN